MNPRARSRLALVAALWVVHVTGTHGIVGAAGGAGRVDASCLLQLAVEESRGIEGNEGANGTGAREVRRGSNETEQQLTGANQTGEGHAEMKRAGAEEERGGVKRLGNATGTRQRKADISMVKDHAVRERARSDPGHWELIFRQSPGSFRSPVSSWLLVNENATDTSSGDYSVLQNLEDFRRSDGTFRLKLTWPGANLQDQVWSQTSNPVALATGGVTGYAAESVAYTSNSWGGLEYNGGNALLDGSVDSTMWFYAVGASQWFSGFPGPHSAVASAELYAWVGDPSTATTATTTTVTVTTTSDPAFAEEGAHWELVFRQAPGSFRSPASSWLLVNENATDTSSGDFSILQHFEGLRRPDGDFLLKLAWPGASVQDQVWRQTSNPITRLTGGVDGYQAVSVPYTGQFWGGLEYNGGHALLDGSVDHSNFFYAVGMKWAWNGGIPGPPLGSSSVPSTELYAWVGADYGVAASDQSSIVGDPHVVNMAREHFAIRAEGRHKLLQIPRSLREKQEPSLRVDAAVEHLGASSCNSTFVRSLAFLGNWTGPLGQLRVTPGSDAPNTTLQANGQEPDAFFGRFPAHDVQVGDTFLGLKFGKIGFHVAKHYEGRYGGQRGYLNLRVTGLKRYSDVGGLLGYDGHADAEKPSPSCVQPQADATAASLVGRGGSSTPGGGGSVISVD